MLVRLLANDDLEQTRRATALFKKETIFIPKTVLLETEWVLRRLYHLERNVVVNAFRKLSGLANVEIEQPQVIIQALQWCEEGMDFADALHLASSRSANKFATFDEKMKKSVRTGTKPAIKLL